MKTSNVLSERLKSYSLFAGSMLASSIAAHGQVIYTDVIPDKEIGGIAPDTFPTEDVDSLDLNNDGIFDFKLSIRFSNALSNGFSFREEAIWDNNPSNLVIPYTVGYVPIMLKLNCDDSIPFPYYMYGFNFGFFAFQNSNSMQFNWDNIHDGVIGLKFKIGSEFHWGWVRLDVNTDTVPNIIIKDYAYEATANKKIKTCDTGTAVGIASLETKNGFTIFPNPSNGIGTIKLEQPIAGELEMIVRDALGNEVYKSNFKMNSLKKELPYDFANLSSGIYFIQLNSETISLSQKWIKQ